MLSARMRLINALQVAANAARDVAAAEAEVIESKRMERWAEILEAEMRSHAKEVLHPVRVFTDYRKETG